MTPRLHQLLTIDVTSSGSLPKFIRSIEPYLSIAQKTQLRKEGCYESRQERDPEHLDENAKPVSASYVRQMVVGMIYPGGKRNLFIVYRYIEEVLKNLDNLELVDVSVLTL